MHIFVFIDNRVSDNCTSEITRHGCVVVRLPSFRGLFSPVSSHADMLTAPVPAGNRVIMSGKYYDENKDILERFGDHIIRTEEYPHGEYPSDVVFDALPAGNILYGREDAVSPTLRSFYGGFVGVRQGYARCSVAMLSDTCGITADVGLYGALQERGVSMLLISHGMVELPGYDYGFIGGAGGRLPDGTYIFFGDPLTHPDGEKMLDFAEKHKIKTAIPDSGMLKDCGGFTCLVTD